MYSHLENKANLARAVANPTRIAILELLLARGEVCVCDIAVEVGVSQPSASKHLGLLRNRGLVLHRKDGLRVLYRLSDNSVRILIETLGEIAGDLKAQMREVVDR